MKKNKGITLSSLIVIIIILLILVGVAILVITVENGIISTYKIDSNLNIQKIENEKGIQFTYEEKAREGTSVNILIIVKEMREGLDKVKLPDNRVIACNGKTEVGIDYTVEIGKEYKVTITSKSGQEKEKTILVEPEIVITEPIISTSTSATTSDPIDSVEKGIPVYIMLTANFEIEGGTCTIDKTIPYGVNSNGTYTFIVTGIFGSIVKTKEIEVEVKQYKAPINLVKYDAGDWTYEDIYGTNGLNNQKLYDINIFKSKGDGTYKLNSSGINFTFGGFTYKDDETNKQYINDGTIITNRNQSVTPQAGHGTPKYDGWQIFETETKINENGDIIKNEDGLDRIYVKSVIHSGSPENFVYYYKNKYDAYRCEYLLSSGQRQKEYNNLSSGETINIRDWNMYKDKKLDENGCIKEVHIMTYGEVNVSTINRNIGSYYWLATSPYNEDMIRIDYYGKAGMTYSYCFGIRPVITMNDGVYIASGSGIGSDPYVLGLEK